MSIKTGPLDTLFSKFIRMRAIARGGCERCGTGKVDIKGLQCSHFYRRNKMSVRWDEDNAAGLCPGCHRYLDDEAVDKVEFFQRLLGQEKYDQLKHRMRQLGTPDKEVLKIYLKAKIREIEL